MLSGQIARKEVGCPRGPSRMCIMNGCVCGASHLMFQMDDKRRVDACETESVSSECPPFHCVEKGGGGEWRCTLL